jgi:hypothetical protein
MAAAALQADWRSRIRDAGKATASVESVRLLSKMELMALFPGACLFEEKMMGLTKSFVAYTGWR